MQTYAKRLSVVRQDIDSIANMHHFIANNADADILYISAHVIMIERKIWQALLLAINFGYLSIFPGLSQTCVVLLCTAKEVRKWHR